MILKTINLCKKIGVFKVDNINLELRSSELTLLIGPNGSGKTMLCRLLCLLLKPDRGKILLNNVDAWSIKDEYKKKLSYVAENEGYPYWLTLEEYMKFFTKIMGLDWSSVEDKIRSLCRELLISSEWYEKLSKFSAGMLRKVSLIRALIKGDIFIWDEPFINLDQKATEIICKKLIELKSKDKIIFII